MDIRLRLIQQDSIEDRTNYFALQKSVALFPDRVLEYQKEYEDKSWQDQFNNKNRICYVIETMPELAYCGECAVKDISVDIPEIEIELMQERQHKGIGYKAIIKMLKELAEKYDKQEFYVKVEPDNYASQFLFEKLEGLPIGLVKDFQISDERADSFINTHRHLLDKRMKNLAEQFDVEADLLLTHLLVYKLKYKNLETVNTNRVEMKNKRKYMECRRALSKEKYKDVMREWLEDLEEIKSYGVAKDKIDAKLADMESKLLNKMELMGLIDLESGNLESR